MTSHNLLNYSLIWRTFRRLLAGQYQAEVVTNGSHIPNPSLYGYKRPERYLPVMELIPYKWYCHQEGISLSPQSSHTYIRSLFGIKRTMT
ncbi:hypothetical protein TNCV_4843461 [Trichonephila clavipes]|uniref:Uncharacterized protein n=1 Tax=Trichonephila clavipes TaxID=2585209 RepID=A0A8X7BMV1_TRICX|nr:hypothetical protein TNCV_4843461 [Trichonephila clavipes]